MRKFLLDKWSLRRIPVFAILCFVLLGLALWAVGDGVYAKYVKKNDTTGGVKAKAFYFQSDLLTEETAVYNLSSDTTSVNFTLQNFADALRVTEDNINYTVTVTTTGEGIPNAELSGITSSLQGNTTDTDTLTLSNLKPGGSYLIEVVGEAGYISNLSAQIDIMPYPEIVYKHVTENASEIILTVWTENVSGNVLISFNGTGLIPDTTMPQLATLYNLEAGSYKAFENYDDPTEDLAANTTRHYRFWKDTGFAGGEFTVTVGEKTAVDGTPH